MTNANDSINSLAIHGKMLNGEDDYSYNGLTKREYFAAMAMQGMLNHGGMTSHGTQSFNPITIAELSTKQADALINELNK